MKHLSLFILLLFLSNFSFSQNYIIVDAETKNPLPFVAVHYDGDGFYAGEHGNFKLPPDIKDSIKLKHLGYHTLNLSLQDLKNIKDTLFMTTNVQALNEVVVYNKPDKREFIKPLKSTNIFGNWQLSSKQEVLVLVYPKGNNVNALLEKIHLPIANRFSWVEKKDKSYSDAYAFIRVNIYNPDKELPGESIYSSPPIKISGYSNDELLLELPEDTYLTFSKDGLFFGIELIGFFNNDQIIKNDKGFINITLTKKESKNFSAATFIKFNFSQDKGDIDSINSILEKGGMIKGEINRNLAIGFTLAPQKN